MTIFLVSRKLLLCTELLRTTFCLKQLAAKAANNNDNLQCQPAELIGGNEALKEKQIVRHLTTYLQYDVQFK